MSNPFEIVKETETKDIQVQEEQKVIEINNEKAKTAMKEHICHKTINYLPLKVKEKSSWMYSNHLGQPVNQDGIKISFKDPKNLHTFNQIITQNTNNMYYTLVLDGSIICVDLDKCFEEDGITLMPFAQDIVQELKEFKPYIEKSRSGNGLHILFEGTDSWKNKKTLQIKMKDVNEKFINLKSGVDFLTSKHCVILTGDIWENNNPQKLGKVNNKIKELYGRLEKMKEKSRPSVNASYKKKLNKNNKSLEESTVFDLINTKVAIEDVINKYDNVDGYSHDNINCPLPGHGDNTPSFKVYHYSNTFYCFGCQKTGDVIQFVSEMEQIRNIESAKKINDWFDLGIDFELLDNKLDESWIIEDGEGKVQVDLTALSNHIIYDHNVIFTEHKIYKYDNNVYKPIKHQQLDKLISDHMPTVYNNKFKDTRFIREVRNRVEIEFKEFAEFNKDKYKLNMFDTTLQFKLNSDEISTIETTPEILTTFQAQGTYNPDYIKNKCDLWHNFLDHALSHGQQKLLQEIMGYLLINNNDAKKFFSFLGKGDTGKSVILRVINMMVGDDSTSAIELQELASKSNKFATSSLFGKLVNICGDLSSKPIEDTSIIKMLTGGDKMRIEEKSKMSIFAYNTARMVYSLNNLPSSYDKSAEFFNRMIIIKFDNVVKKKDQIRDLEKLFDLNYIINWSIEGLRRLMKHNLEFSLQKENLELVSDYTTLDVPIVEFMNDFCEVTMDKKDAILNSTFIDAYKYFAGSILMDTKMEHSIKLKNVVNDLNSRYTIKQSKNILIPSTGKKNGRGFVGIKFKEEFKRELKSLSIF